MDYEIHLFSAVGLAGPVGPYPLGERHPMLIFLRQLRDSEHDFATATALATEAGWTDLDFTRAGTLPDDAGRQPAEPFHSCYAEARDKGSALMVYDVSVVPAPPSEKKV